MFKVGSFNRELKQPRRRRQQKPHKFAYLFWHFEDVLVLSTTWNDLFCSCVDDTSIWWQMFNFVFLCPERWFQFNSRIVRTHFSDIMTLNNWKMIAETRSDIFRWRSRFRRRRVCLSSLISNHDDDGNKKPHKFAYLTVKNIIFARFARACFIFWRFKDVLVLSTTWDDLFCSCVDDVSISPVPELSFLAAQYSITIHESYRIFLRFIWKEQFTSLFVLLCHFLNMRINFWGRFFPISRLVFMW